MDNGGSSRLNGSRIFTPQSHLVSENMKYRRGIVADSISAAAFIGALIVGVSLHYNKIVQNEYYGWPQEWFPSVSATIGDRYPERSFFQVFIAITSGPRFALVFFWWLLAARPGSALPSLVAFVGLFRTITCGGWTYVTSSDDHKWHDIFMISYLVATLPWTLGCLFLSPPNPQSRKYRKILASLFFGTLVPLIYYFIQHKVHRVPGGQFTPPASSRLLSDTKTAQLTPSMPSSNGL